MSSNPLTDVINQSVSNIQLPTVKVQVEMDSSSLINLGIMLGIVVIGGIALYFTLKRFA